MIVQMKNIVSISSKVNMCIYDEVKWFILFDVEYEKNSISWISWWKLMWSWWIGFIKKSFQEDFCHIIRIIQYTNTPIRLELFVIW